MPKELERDLGLYAVLTVSIGAMVGSGIFVLPGEAAKIAGPAAIVAYLLAGLLVLPAALSKAEMATAMPEAGGTYLYIDRAMGPMFGTVAGIGAWFSLVFKSAFALVGLGAYLVLLVSLPVKPVALAAAASIVVLNVVGVKQSGRFQAVVVSVVLLALLAFILDGITFVESARYHPFSPKGPVGVFEATGFVFVSYAGVTKIASVAEEVENPGRNIPIGMLGSVVGMMLVYTFVVFVIIGTTPLAELEGTRTPMSTAARGLFGGVGAILFAFVAVFALSSMANAGVLSSSRFPFAMGRDDLAPARLKSVHPQFSTPVASIVLTGGLLVVLIATVPIFELAKLASAFKIIVFAFVNVALIAFREADLGWYDPEWTAPGYPWVQLVGIVGGIALLTQMGTLPLAGALGIVVAGLVWYRVYGRERTDREGAAFDAIRRTATDRALERTRELSDGLTAPRILLALGDTPNPDREATLLRIAADMVRGTDGRIMAVQFETVPQQTTLSSAAAEQTPAELAFEEETSELAEVFDAPVKSAEVVSHDRKRAIVNFATAHDIDVILGEWERDILHPELLGTDVDWFIEHGSSNAIFVHNQGLTGVNHIAVVAESGPYDPLEVVTANSIARNTDATIELLYTVDEDATDEKLASIERYQDALAALCDVSTTSRIIRTDEPVSDMEAATGDADLVVVGTSAHHVLYDVLVGAFPDRLAERLPQTVLLVHTRSKRRHTFLRYVLDRLIH